MWKDLFINGCILIAFLFVGGQYYKNKPIRLHSPWPSKVSLGIASGVLGIILMLFSIKMTPTFIMDLRNLAVVLAAVIGGFLPAVISGIMIAIGRITLFPISERALIVAASYLFIGVGTGYLAQMIKNYWKRWIVAVLYSSTISSICFYLVIPKEVQLSHVYLYHWVMNSLFAIIVSFLIDYIRHANDHYRLYKQGSNTDFLTGLNNVRTFDHLLQEVLQKAIKLNQNASLLVLDIDHFKRVNDTYGHIAGDEVLRQLSGILTASSRSVDIVSRNGGEEFSIILPASNQDEAILIGERIRHAVENHPFLLPDGRNIAITVSVGVATMERGIQQATEIFKRADEALYEAKKTGRNKVCYLESAESNVNSKIE